MFKHIITAIMLVFITSCGQKTKTPHAQIGSSAEAEESLIKEAYDAAVAYQKSGENHDLQLLLATFKDVVNEPNGLKSLATYHKNANNDANNFLMLAELKAASVQLKPYGELISSAKPHKDLKAVYELYFTESPGEQASSIENLLKKPDQERLLLLAVLVKLDHGNINHLQKHGAFDAELAMSVLELLPDMRSVDSLRSEQDKDHLRVLINLKKLAKKTDEQEEPKEDEDANLKGTKPPAEAASAKAHAFHLKKQATGIVGEAPAMPQRFDLSRALTEAELNKDKTGDSSAAQASTSYFSSVVNTANATYDAAYYAASATYGAAAYAAKATCDATVAAGQFVYELPTKALGVIVGDEAAKSIVDFSNDKAGTDAVKKLFNDKLQPSLYMLGAREQFGDYVLKSILYPRAQIVTGAAKACSQIAKAVAPDCCIGNILDKASDVGNLYSDIGLDLKGSETLLKEWNEAEQQLSDEDLRDTAQFVTGISQNLSEINTAFTNSKTKSKSMWTSLKANIAQKISSTMSEEDARKEAARWVSALSNNIGQALKDQTTSDKLAILLHMLYNAGYYSMEENPLVDYLAPAIQSFNNKLNRKYVESQVVNAGIDLTKDLITGPIQAFALAKYSEPIGQLNQFLNYENVKSALETIEHAEKLLYWSMIKIKLLEYASSVLYLMDTIYVEKTDNNQKYWDVSFNRLIKAHLSRDLRKDHPLAIDYALNNIFSLAGKNRDSVEKLFFSSLATIELARSTSEFSNAYPPVRPVFAAILSTASSVNQNVADWMSLPPGDMAILFKYAIQQATNEAGLVKIKSTGKNNFFVDAASQSALTKIQNKNIAKAAMVSTGKVALATYTSPLSGLFMGVFEACKIGAATQSGNMGAKGLAFATGKLKADKNVQHATHQGVTFMSTLGSTIYAGFDAVPADFKAQFQTAK